MKTLLKFNFHMHLKPNETSKYELKDAVSKVRFQPTTFGLIVCCSYNSAMDFEAQLVEQVVHSYPTLVRHLIFKFMIKLTDCCFFR